MGLRFSKRITLFKGVSLNLSKSGVSLSLGTKGLRGTVGTNGKVTTSVGIPGTGVYYTKQFGLNKKKNTAKTGSTVKQAAAQPEAQPTAAAPAPTVAPASQAAAPAASAPAANEMARQEYDKYEQVVTAARSIHMTCDQPIDWQQILQRPAPAANGSLADAIRGADSEAYARWQQVHDLAAKVTAGDIDAYLQVIAEMKPFDDLLEYGSGFEVGTDRPDVMTVEFRAHCAQAIPNYILSVTADEKLSSTPMPADRHNELVQDYVCSTSLRVARDVLALLPVAKVVVHAVDGDGAGEGPTVLSAVFDRTTMAGLDMAKDPSDLVGCFPSNMSFTKTAGFAPVERLTVKEGE